MENNINNTINLISPSWSKTQIIRFLYVKLAPYFRRDVKYFLASYEENLRQYKQGFINNGFDIVCSTLSDFYVDLFKMFDINAIKIEATNKEIPLFALIVEADEGWIFMDPLNDLFSNQYGLRTNYFGVIPDYQGCTVKENYPFLTQYSKEFLSELDSSLNLYPGNIPLSEYFEYLHNEFTNKKNMARAFGLDKYDKPIVISKKFEYCAQHFINLGEVNGVIERSKLYNYLLRILFDRAERRDTHINITKENDIYVPKILIAVPGNEKIIYEEEKDNGSFVLRKK